MDYTSEFQQQAEYMRDYGFNPYSQRLNIAVPNARERLMAGLHYFLGDKAKWLDCYDELADWLTDNKGRGLLCIGTCGLGKTLLCQNILPVLIHQYTKVVPEACTANEMNSKVDRLQDERCVIVDDLGVEAPETNTYGNRRFPFNELCDAAERHGSMLIITTNLRTTHKIDPQTHQAIPSIEDRYGIRTLDRLRAITKVVVFSGESMRG